MIGHWWKRHFDSAGRPDGPGDSDQFERCPCCGQAFNARDLEQVLPHFEHQLAAGARQPEKLGASRGSAAPSGKCRAVPSSSGRLGEGDLRGRESRVAAHGRGRSRKDEVRCLKNSGIADADKGHAVGRVELDPGVGTRVDDRHVGEALEAIGADVDPVVIALAEVTRRSRRRCRARRRRYQRRLRRSR